MDGYGTHATTKQQINTRAHMGTHESTSKTNKNIFFVKRLFVTRLVSSAVVCQLPRFWILVHSAHMRAAIVHTHWVSLLCQKYPPFYHIRTSDVHWALGAQPRGRSETLTCARLAPKDALVASREAEALHLCSISQPIGEYCHMAFGDALSDADPFGTS